MVILREAFYIHSTLIQTELRESERYLHVLVSVIGSRGLTIFSICRCIRGNSIAHLSADFTTLQEK